MQENKIFKSGLKKVTNIVIGGPDTSDLPSKSSLLQARLDQVEYEVQARSNEIISKAELKAQAMLIQANGEVETIVQRAQEQGFEAGRQEGLRNAYAEMQNYLEACSKILTAIEQERRECLESEEERVHQIIIQIAKHLVKKNFSLNPALTLDFIKNAINSLDQKIKIQLYVEPKAANEIIKIKDSIKAEFTSLNELNIIPESKLQSGDLIIESDKQRMDLRLESLFEELEKNFRQ